MAEAVGLYCSALGEIEDEMRDLGLSGDKIAKGKGKQRTRASSSDEEEESGSSDDDDEDEDRSAKQKRGVPQQPHPRSTSTLLSALRDLDDRYHLIETGRKRVLKEEAALVKLKDELRELRNEWTRRAGAGAGAGASEGGVQGVQWGQRTGDEFGEKRKRPINTLKTIVDVLFLSHHRGSGSNAHHTSPTANSSTHVHTRYALRHLFTFGISSFDGVFPSAAGG